MKEREMKRGEKHTENERAPRKKEKRELAKIVSPATQLQG